MDGKDMRKISNSLQPEELDQYLFRLLAKMYSVIGSILDLLFPTH
jgi:hypothetical protein